MLRTGKSWPKLAVLLALLAMLTFAACGGDDEPEGGGGGGGDGGVNVPGTNVSVPPLPSTNVEPVDQVLNLTQATLQCTLDGLNQLLQPQAFQQCLNDYMS